MRLIDCSEPPAAARRRPGRSPYGLLGPIKITVIIGPSLGNRRSDNDSVIGPSAMCILTTTIKRKTPRYYSYLGASYLRGYLGLDQIGSKFVASSLLRAADCLWYVLVRVQIQNNTTRPPAQKRHAIAILLNQKLTNGLTGEKELTREDLQRDAEVTRPIPHIGFKGREQLGRIGRSRPTAAAAVGRSRDDDGHGRDGEGRGSNGNACVVHM